MLRRCASILIAFASLLVSSGAPAQTVLSRARLGNNIEDITFVSSGPLAGNLAIMNGYELFLAPLDPPGSQTKFFDARTTPITNGPRGLAYIESQGLLAFHTSDSGTLYLVDQDGVFQGTRPMVFLGAAATYLEGMDYLPPSSPFYADHLIVVANTFTDTSLTPRIEIVRLDGTVEAEIFPQPFGPQPDGSFLFDPASYGMLGLAYKSPDRLLVTLYDGTDNVWQLDFNGNVVGGGPVYTDAGNTSFEGIVQVADGRIVVSNYFTGNLLFFDSNMNRLPAEDRTYSVGIGVSASGSIAWSTDTDSHLVMNRSTAPSLLSTIPTSLDSAVSVALEPRPGQLPFQLTYLPAEHFVATLARRAGLGQTFIRLFDPSTGAFNSEVEVTAALGGGAVRGLAYIPTMNQFAVGVSGGATPNALKILTRAGALVRTIDLSATGLSTPFAVAHFAPSPGADRFLILGGTASGRTIVVTDFNGNVLPGGFNTRAGLNLSSPGDLSTISTGPYAGAFGIVDSDNSELVVFRLAYYLAALSPAHLWIGLKNGDDQGARFDLKADLLKNGTPVASGLQRCITGVTRNPADAREAVMPFGSFAAVPVAPGDVLALRVSTRIGTNPDDTKCPGHTNAAGLRLYYDAANRPSRFDATIALGPNRDLYLRSDGTLNATAPAAGTAKSKDSGSVNFAGGNPFSAIGTWSLAPLP